MAKDILLADSIDRIEQAMREHPRRDSELRLKLIMLAGAAAQMHAAHELTDMTLDPPVSEDYAGLRAIALPRADEAPGGETVPARAEIPGAERDRLRDELLSSPEGQDVCVRW